MRTIHPLIALGPLLVLVAACAQPMGPQARGGGMGPGPMARAGSDFTPGWTMMTPEEREQHRQRMMTARTPEQCREFRDEHMQRMQERAMARNMQPMPMPHEDACAGMQP